MLRAWVIFLMFSVFSVLFYIDGTTGYRKKNYEYYLHATFEKATSAFSKMQAEAPLTASTWKEYASQQTVDFPEDPAVLPADLKLPMPWPEVLWDFDQVKTLQHNHLWEEYSEVHEYGNNPVENPYDAGEIEVQIRVLYICLTLALGALFFLIRTSMRFIRIDEKGLRSADGKIIPFSAMRVLDLRKWDTKGIAYLEHETAAGMKRCRIDGLTYGGFRKERGQPAEELMKRIRKNFSGEIIEYGEEKTED